MFDRVLNTLLISPAEINHFAFLHIDETKNNLFVWRGQTYLGISKLAQNLKRYSWAFYGLNSDESRLEGNIKPWITFTKPSWENNPDKITPI